MNTIAIHNIVKIIIEESHHEGDEYCEEFHCKKLMITDSNDAMFCINLFSDGRVDIVQKCTD